MIAVDTISSDEFLGNCDRYVKRNVPVVIKAPDDLPCLKWNTEYLRQTVGGEPVPVPGGKGYNEDLSYLSKEQLSKMTLAEYFDFIAAHPGSSELVYFNVSRLPRLNGESRLPSGYEKRIHKKMFATNLWISAKGHVTSFHYDPVENVNVQIGGAKRFSIFKPALRRFYPRSPLTFLGHFSRIQNINSYDRDTFPQFPIENRCDVELAEREMLYLPYCWWHQVESIGDINLNFNFWWLPGPSKMIKYPNQVFRSLLTAIYRKAIGAPTA